MTVNALLVCNVIILLSYNYEMIKSHLLKQLFRFMYFNSFRHICFTCFCRYLLSYECGNASVSIDRFQVRKFVFEHIPPHPYCAQTIFWAGDNKKTPPGLTYFLFNFPSYRCVRVYSIRSAALCTIRLMGIVYFDLVSFTSTLIVLLTVLVDSSILLTAYFYFYSGGFS